MRAHALMVLGSVLAAALAAAPSARACQPPYPGLTGSVPVDGASLPANARIFFFGYDISLEGVTATVNGAPATLLAGVAPNGLDALAATIEPEPAPGDTVIVSGDFCPAGYGCEPQSLKLAVVARDEAPPAPPSGASFNVYDHIDFESSGGDCQSSSDLAYYVHAKGAPAAEGESAVVYTVDVLDDGIEQTFLFADSRVVTGAETTFTMRLGAEILGGDAPAEGLCFRVSAVDAASHAAVKSELLCQPCYSRVDPGGGAPESPPAEPAWGEVDVYPWGPCGGPDGPTVTATSTASGAATTGATGGAGGGDAAEPVEVGGCGCRVGPARLPSWWAVVAGAVGVAALRRRRRR